MFKHELTIKEELENVKKIKNIADTFSKAKNVGLNKFKERWTKIYNKMDKREQELKSYLSMMKGIYSTITYYSHGHDFKEYRAYCPHCDKTWRINRRKYKKYLHTIISCKTCHQPLFVEKAIHCEYYFSELKSEVQKLNTRFGEYCNFCGVQNCKKHLNEQDVNCMYIPHTS